MAMSRKCNRWLLAIGALLLAAAAVLVLTKVIGGGGAKDARGALVGYCRRQAPLAVFEYPSPVPGTQYQLSAAPSEWDFTEPVHEQGFPDESGLIYPDACGSLEPLARREGSPPESVDPTESSSYGWYLVRHADGEGWVHFYDAALDEGIRASLAGLELATFPEAEPGLFDLAAGMTSSAEVGDPCGAGTVWVFYQPTVTNTGTGTSPRSFQVQMADSTAELERVVTVELVRGLQPGETLRFGWMRSGWMEIDPDHLLDEPDDDNDAGGSATELVCRS